MSERVIAVDVAVADGGVYFGCACGLVMALNATTGAQKWPAILFRQATNQSLTVANGVGNARSRSETAHKCA